MNHHEEIAAIEAAAAAFAPPPLPFAVLTVGEIRFVAYDDDVAEADGDLWLVSDESAVRFCRNADGTWYCVAGSTSDTAATPELALSKVLHRLARNMRALTNGGVELTLRGEL